MADDKDPKDPGTDPKDGDPKDAGGIEATVRRVLAELLPKRGGGAAEHDVTAQVEAAVAKVHKGQKAESVIADLQARLDAVEKKPAPEKKPKEYRRITTRIWGADDDD